MRLEDIEEMRRLRCSRSSEQHHVEAMLKAAFLQRFPAHVELVREGDPPDFLHVVIDGQVEVLRLP